MPPIRTGRSRREHATVARRCGSGRGRRHWHRGEAVPRRTGGTRGRAVRCSAETILWLEIKELRSFLHNTVLIVLVTYAFSFAVFSQVRSNSKELSKAPSAVADEDNSPLSRRIMHAFLPPLPTSSCSR